MIEPHDLTTLSQNDPIHVKICFTVQKRPVLMRHPL